MLLGDRRPQLIVSAAWKSPSAVAPSPTQPAAILLSPFIALAIAKPVACGSCVPKLPEMVKKLTDAAD